MGEGMAIGGLPFPNTGVFYLLFIFIILPGMINFGDIVSTFI